MNDPHNCKHDREQELIDQAEQDAHEAGECWGDKRCIYCVLDRQTGEERG